LVVEQQLWALQKKPVLEKEPAFLHASALLMYSLLFDDLEEMLLGLCLQAEHKAFKSIR
jgi:hypothetical protein